MNAVKSTLNGAGYAIAAVWAYGSRRLSAVDISERERRIDLRGASRVPTSNSRPRAERSMCAIICWP
jgi:hypothetical protein